LVLLVAREGKVLSGAAHFKATKCRIGGKGKKDGIVMRKLRKKPKPKFKPKPKPKPGPVVGTKLGGQEVDAKDDQGNPLVAEVTPTDPKAFEKNQPAWQTTMEEGAGQMQAGFFERARRKFFKATELNPTRPEAFNGIGVTYYARNDYQEALRWYKKALEVNADFGDAYYNMACIYAIQRKKELAFRYLNIAALNGFVQPQVLSKDPDLNNLRDDARFGKILKKMKAKAR
jgi:TPR repeat protein